MHVAFGQFSSARPADADVHVDLRNDGTPLQAVSWQPSSYGGGRRFSAGSIAVVAGIHAALFAALISLDIVPVGKAKVAPTVVEMLDMPEEPPPSAPPPPPTEQATPEPLNPIQTPIVSPPPIVRTLSAPPPVLAAARAMPEPPAPVAKAAAAPPAPPAPAQEGPVKAGDLSSKMLAGKPPKYPIESRKKKEQGTVLLTVLLDLGGSVSEISVARSSGHQRLDKAALDAVRRWRWSPTMRDGAPVMVRGTVQIPFILTV